jgi:hypothetical protein
MGQKGHVLQVDLAPGIPKNHSMGGLSNDFVTDSAINQGFFGDFDLRRI